MSDPIKFLFSELESANQATKINAVHRISIIITIVGPEQTKKTILPYLDTMVKKEDDEVLFALAEVMPFIAENFRPKALKILEKLLCIEETVVREKAIDSLIEICKPMQANEIKDEIIPLIIEISNFEKFTGKCSALSIITAIYKQVNNDQKSKLKELFLKSFSEDASAMVKRTFSNKIGDLCQELTKDEILKDVMPYIKKLANDDTDTIKILMIEGLPKLCKFLTLEESKNSIIPIIIQLTSEKNWRIKIALAKNYHLLVNALGKETNDTNLISIYSTILRDSENEVRIEAVKGLKLFVNDISSEKINQIIPYLQSLSNDSNSLVKTGVCEILGDIVKHLSHDVINAKLKGPIVDLFKDKDVEVKMEILKILKIFAKAMNNDFLNLWNSIDKESYMSHINWRIRDAFAKELIELIIIYLPNYDFIVKNLFPYFSRFIEDNAYVVRNNYMYLIKKVGGAKLLADIKISKIIYADLDKVTKASRNYKFKISGIDLIFELLPYLKEDTFNKVIDLLITLMDDNVQNVRFYVLKLLNNNWKYIKNCNKEAQIISNIKKMNKEDHDEETKYKANQLIKNYNLE